MGAGLSIDPKHARFGPGVYLTTMSPRESVTKILINNFDDDTSKTEIQKLIRKKGNKTEVCIQIVISGDLPMDKVERCDTKRDIYLYKGDLSFDDVDSVGFYIRD
ncbi:uncharacterized protein LOC128243635 isoform X2 [Mya arenaria]|uniref:uncharacterized protein LOC128243635 isoform X2 n=1 Tax=Mya arenaria TaxID=6604 RepID=UPI0022E12A07|nr:uncharacterized protein LOC128243635 isoform X2 [Mya arenaria]